MFGRSRSYPRPMKVKPDVRADDDGHFWKIAGYRSCLRVYGAERYLAEVTITTLDPLAKYLLRSTTMAAATYKAKETARVAMPTSALTPNFSIKDCECGSNPA